MNQKFSRMLKRVGRAFYLRYLSAVREAVKNNSVKALFKEAALGWNGPYGKIETAKYRIRAIASAVRQGYDYDLDGGLGSTIKKPVIQKSDIKYWIEVYWPIEPGEREGEDKLLYLYFHKKKLAANKKVQKGDKVLFYETEQHPDQSWLGARAIFACGEVADDAGEPISPRSYSGKRWWVWKRPIRIEKSVAPAKGVPFSTIRKILGWGPRAKLRRGPMSIDAKTYKEISALLGKTENSGGEPKSSRKSSGFPRQFDVAKRVKTEKRAIEIAYEWYRKRGYSVKSVEKENLGWDLEAHSAGHTILVEVKGLSGRIVSIGLTPNEYSVMQKTTKKAYYRIFVVTGSLGKNPKPHEFFYSSNPPRWENSDGKSLRVQEIISANLTMS